MSEKDITTGNTPEVDYASQFCADSEEELEIPHAELPPARKVICVVETCIMAYLTFLSGEILVGHALHLFHRLNIMYAVPYKFFLKLIIPFAG